VTGPAEAFASDGIVVLPGFFSAAECAGANAFLDRCEAEAPRRSHAVTRAVLGEGGVQIYGTFAFGTPRGCGQGWHQDTAEAAPDQFSCIPGASIGSAATTPTDCG